MTSSGKLSELPTVNLYQSSTLGAALEETVAEMTEAGMFEKEYKEVVMSRFEAEFEKMLNTSDLKQAKIEGKVIEYKCMTDVWQFVIKNLRYNVNGLHYVARDSPTKVICMRRR